MLCTYDILAYSPFEPPDIWEGSCLLAKLVYVDQFSDLVLLCLELATVIRRSLHRGTLI